MVTMGMSRWTVPLGNFMQAPIRLHIAFIALLVLEVLHSIPPGGWYSLLIFMMWGPVLLFSILINMAGRCLAVRSIGGTVDSILLWPLGGIAFVSYKTTYARGLWCSIAGTLTHIPMMGIWFLLCMLMPPYGKQQMQDFEVIDAANFLKLLCATSVVVNFFLLVFGLVPAYPLDGGRILAVLMLMVGFSMRATAIVTLVVTTIISMGLIVYGIVYIHVAKILIAVFILFGASGLFMALKADKLAEHPLFSNVSAGASGYSVVAAAEPSGGGDSVQQKPTGKQSGSTPEVAMPTGSSARAGIYIPPAVMPPEYPPSGDHLPAANPATGHPLVGYPAGVGSGFANNPSAVQAV